MPGKSATKKETIILIGVGLLTIIGVTFGIFKGIGQPIDGPETLAERFAFSEIPLELEHSEAHVLGSGDRMVRLDRKASSSLGAQLPSRVIVMFNRKPRGASLYFPPHGESVKPEDLAKWKADPSQTFKAEISRGRVAFGDWETPYIRERIFRDTGHWTDSMRVNLTTKDLPCILFAEFPEEAEGNETGLITLLNGLKLK